MLHSLWKWLRKATPRTIRRGPSRWLKPAAEALEDRTLLSITADLIATVAISSHYNHDHPISARGETIHGMASFLVDLPANPGPEVVYSEPPPVTDFTLSLTLPADMDILLNGVSPAQFVANRSGSLNTWTYGAGVLTVTGHLSGWGPGPAGGGYVERLVFGGLDPISFQLQPTSTFSGSYTVRAQFVAHDLMQVPDPNLVNNTSSQIGHVSSANLVMVQHDPPPAVVRPGDQLDYTYVITNQGPDDAFGVDFINTLPDDAEAIGISGVTDPFTYTPRVAATPGSPPLGGQMVGRVGDLRVGESKTVIVRLKAPLHHGAFENQVAFLPDLIQSLDPDTTNNSAHSPLAVNALVIDIPSPPNGVPLDSDATYHIRVRNLGDQPLEDVAITVTSSEGGPVTFPAQALAAGAERIVDLTLHLMTQGTTQVSATATTSTLPTLDPELRTATVFTRVGVADLAISVEGSTNVRAGDVVTYTATVKNLGPDPAKNVHVVDSLLGSFSSLTTSQTGSVTIMPAGNGQTGSTIVWRAGELASGDSTTLTIHATASADGVVMDHASVLAQTFDPVQVNNSVDLAPLIVTSTGDEDLPDGPFNPSAPLSLRAAIQKANLLPDFNLITFNIPGTGVPTIQPTRPLPIITGTVTIDATTQPGGRVEIQGNRVGLGPDANGLVLAGGNSIVRGLVINDFARSGIVLKTLGGNLLEGNYIGTNAAGTAARANIGRGIFIDGVGNNVIGGQTAAARNLISGNRNEGIWIRGSGASNNRIEGNYIGTDVTGTLSLGNETGILIEGASNNIIGSSNGLAGNVISGQRVRGIKIDIDALGNRIVGNTIGTDPTGTVAVPNEGTGVSIDGSDNIVGGVSVQERNIISGNGTGIALDSTSNIQRGKNRIQGNYIGTQADGTSALGNRLEGIRIGKSFNNLIGGDTPEAGNVIAFNGLTVPPDSYFETGYGVFVENGTGNSIRRNTIFGNGNRGIGLVAKQFNMNDPGVFNLETGAMIKAPDRDDGANHLQNFPVLESVVNAGGITRVNGSLDSTPNRTFHLDFYANTTYDKTGFGAGEKYLHSIDVHTDARGHASFVLALATSSRYIAVTATDKDEGNTSEFSLIDTDFDGIADAWETRGIDYNGDDHVDLRLPGANVAHKDIYVEVDAMVGRAPEAHVLERVVDAFAAAPVANGDGVTGIALHATLDDANIPIQGFPHAFADFYRVKNGNSDQGSNGFFGTAGERAGANWATVRAAKLLVYRYAMFADFYGTTSSSGLANAIPGTDFMVTLGGWRRPGGTANQQAGTFMHELGHTLGLRHGGADHVNYKPNYHSLMNYTWQTPGSEISDLAYRASWVLDYSRIRLADLNESQLDESTGIGGTEGKVTAVGPIPARAAKEVGPVDWNRDGIINTGVVQADINYLPDESPSPHQLLTGYDDWAHIQYSFLQSSGFGSAGGDVGNGGDHEELTFEQHQHLSELGFVKGTIHTDQPTFTWEEAANVGSYVLVVVDSSTGATVVHVTGITETFYTLARAQALTPGREYDWYLGVVANHTLQYGSPTHFRVAPLVAPPQHGPSGLIASATGYDRPAFRWEGVVNADRYHLYVVDTTTGQAVINRADLRATFYTPGLAEALTPGHTFVWFVGAVSTNGLVNSYHPAGQRFTLADLTAPSMNTLPNVIPASPGFDRPSFSWGSVPGADHYYLYVVDHASGQVIINNPNVGATSFTATQPFTPGRSYRWFVGAISADGLVNSHDAAGQGFTLAPLAAPAMNGPVGTIAAADGYDLPTFTWSAVAGAHHYYLYVVEHGTGRALIDQPVSGTTFTAARPFTPGRVYTWYVGARSGNDQINSYLPGGRSFTLAALAAPIQNLPSGFTESSTPTFSWSAVAGADHYYLYVIDHATGQAVVNNPSVAGTSIVSPISLVRGRRYTWYLGAISTDGLVNRYLVTGVTIDIVS